MNERKRNAARTGAALAAAAFAGIAAAQDVPPSHKANPDIYRVIAEDERYRVLEATWKGGQKDDMHSHPKGLVVHFLTDCHSRTVTRDGMVVEIRRKAGETRISPPVVAHTFENLATTDCRHIHVEMK